MCNCTNPRRVNICPGKSQQRRYYTSNESWQFGSICRAKCWLPFEGKSASRTSDLTVVIYNCLPTTRAEGSIGKATERRINSSHTNMRQDRVIEWIFYLALISICQVCALCKFPCETSDWAIEDLHGSVIAWKKIKNTSQGRISDTMKASILLVISAIVLPLPDAGFSHLFEFS